MDEKKYKTDNAILALLLQQQELEEVKQEVGLVSNGDEYETHAGKFFTTDDIITLRDKATVGLGSTNFAGIKAKKYDGLNDGQLVFDADGYARVGDEDSLQMIATRENTPTNKGIAYYDETTRSFKTKAESSLSVAQAVNANKLGGVVATNYARTDENEIFNNNLKIIGIIETGVKAGTSWNHFGNTRENTGALTVPMYDNSNATWIWQARRDTNRGLGLAGVQVLNSGSGMRSFVGNGFSHQSTSAFCYYPDGSNKCFEIDSTGTKTIGKSYIEGLNGLKLAQTPEAETIGYYTTLKSHHSAQSGELAFKGAGGAGWAIGGLDYGAATGLYANDTEVAKLHASLVEFKVNTKTTGTCEADCFGMLDNFLKINKGVAPLNAKGQVAGSSELGLQKATANENDRLWIYKRDSNGESQGICFDGIGSGIKMWSPANSSGRILDLYDEDAPTVSRWWVDGLGKTVQTGEAWASRHVLSSDIYVGRAGNYIGLVSAGNEMQFTGNSSALHINYRLQDGKTAPDTWYWKAGSSGSDTSDYASHHLRNVYSHGTIGSHVFTSGFTGSGWRIDHDGTANFDNAYIRKTLNVYELLIQKIRSVNGSIVVSSANGKVASTSTIHDGATMRVVLEEAGGFVVGDRYRCQTFRASKGVKYYVSGNIGWISTDGKVLDIYNYTTSWSGTDFPEVGDEIVQWGSTVTDRQGMLYMTASDSGAPYFDVLDGVNGADMADKTKVRLGKLDGITSPVFGNLSGYGLWTQNGYLEGGINATFGKIARWNIAGDRIWGGTGVYNGSSNKGLDLYTDGNYSRVLAYSDKGYVNHYYYSPTDWGLLGQDSTGAQVFKLGSQNNIAGWTFTNKALYTGTGSYGDGVNIGLYKESLGTDSALHANEGLQGLKITYYNDFTGGEDRAGVRAVMGALSDAYFYKNEENGKYGFELVGGRKVSNWADVIFRASVSKSTGELDCRIAGWKFDDYRITSNVSNSDSWSGESLLKLSTKNSGSSYIYNGSQTLQGLSLMWHKANNAGHIVLGQIAASGTSIKNGYKGIQMMRYTGEEYFCLSAKVDQTGGSTFYNRIAGWVFDERYIRKGSLYIDSVLNNIYCQTSTYANREWSLENDGSGRLAKGNIAWDASGNVVLSSNVKMSWSNVTGTGDIETKSGAQNKANIAANRTTKQIDLRDLDVNTYYPITIQCTPSAKYKIRVNRSLSMGYGVPSYTTHTHGFSCLYEWTTNGSGWGTIPIKREILTSNSAFHNGNVAGDVSQIYTSSEEFIYVRGGSRYDVTVYGGVNIPIILRVSSYTIHSTTISPRFSVSEPVTDMSSLSSLAASKITSDQATTITKNTVTAAYVNAFALNASSITTGILNAARIATGSLHGNKITAGTITADHISGKVLTGVRVEGTTLTTNVGGDSAGEGTTSAINIETNRIKATRNDGAIYINYKYAGSGTNDTIFANAANRQGLFIYGGNSRFEILQAHYGTEGSKRVPYVNLGSHDLTNVRIRGKHVRLQNVNIDGRMTKGVELVSGGTGDSSYGSYIGGGAGDEAEVYIIHPTSGKCYIRFGSGDLGKIIYVINSNDSKSLYIKNCLLGHTSFTLAGGESAAFMYIGYSGRTDSFGGKLKFGGGNQGSRYWKALFVERDANW